MYYAVKKGKKTLTTVNAESIWHAIDLAITKLQKEGQSISRKTLKARPI